MEVAPTRTNAAISWPLSRRPAGLGDVEQFVGIATPASRQPVLASARVANPPSVTPKPKRNAITNRPTSSSIRTPRTRQRGS